MLTRYIATLIICISMYKRLNNMFISTYIYILLPSIYDIPVSQRSSRKMHRRTSSERQVAGIQQCHRRPGRAITIC